MKTTIKTLSKPVSKNVAASAPKAPIAKPGKPIAKTAAPSPAKAPIGKPGKPGSGIVVRPSKENVKPTAPSANASPDLVAKLAGLTKQLEEAQTRLAKSEARAKASKAGLSLAELTKGIKIPKGDWREAYQGEIVNLYPFGFFDGEIKADTSRKPVPHALCIPRDSMKGGTSARTIGEIAVLFALCEDGETWERNSVGFLNAEELAAVWP